jgi:hypothetical protein
MGPQINLGDRVRDEITGFVGIVTGLVSYISGCDQALLAPPVAEDGSHREGRWYDLDRLVVLEAAVFSVREAASVGFDTPAPIR